jgi:hypothetical protein
MPVLAALPDNPPTTRDFTMDRWPQRDIKTRNGITLRQPLVSEPAGAELELAWENITSNEAEAILATWDDSYGMYGDLDDIPGAIGGLPFEVDPQDRILLGNLVSSPFPNCTWRFAGPPETELVKRNRCTVRLRLRTRRNITEGMEP